jgi:prepilin-type N-terminal cleavage/methylation domain-containing protein
MSHFNRKQTGFTLVEIAIVLVIIGLLLGGVLKGQSMIDNARAKALVNDYRSVVTMMNAFRDSYKAVAGDDPKGNEHTGGLTSSNRAGNGLVDTGTWIGLTTPAATDESSLFWQHVRLVGLALGSTNSGEAENAVGGRLGVTSNDLRVTSPVGTGASPYVVCSAGIPGRLARIVDAQLDDGVPNTGDVFGAAELADHAPINTATPAATAYAIGSFYTICFAQ